MLLVPTSLLRTSKGVYSRKKVWSLRLLEGIAGSTAKKASKRRISFRHQAADSDNEEEAGSQQQGADGPAGTMLSADNIEEDEEPASEAPPSSMVMIYHCAIDCVHAVNHQLLSAQAGF